MRASNMSFQRAIGTVDFMSAIRPKIHTGNKTQNTKIKPGVCM